MSTKVRIENVRLAFPALWEPKAVNAGDKPSYSAAFLMPPDHPAVPEIEKAMKQAAKDKWGDKWEAVFTSLVKGLKVCLHDGDAKAEYDGFRGHMYVSASSKSTPLVIDRNRNQLNERDGRPYAGCYVNVSLEIWAQDNNYGKRINAMLKGVQFVRDGDAFTGGGAPASPDDFDDLGDTGDDDTFI